MVNKRRSLLKKPVLGIIVHDTVPKVEAKSVQDDLNMFKYCNENAKYAPLYNFIIGHDGTRFELSGADYVAYHAGRGSPARKKQLQKRTDPDKVDISGRQTASINHQTIGVGLNRTGREKIPQVMFNELNVLVDELCDYHGIIRKTNVIEHSEWTTRKVDAGHLDMRTFRTRYGDGAAAIVPATAWPGKELRRGIVSTHVLMLDEKLASLGLLKGLGKASEKYGRGTYAAVKRFQKWATLPVTGVVDAKTWETLKNTKSLERPVARVKQVGERDNGVLGVAVVAAPEVCEWLVGRASRARYSADVLREIVVSYWVVGAEYGVRPEVALAQAIKETGGFGYGGDVKAEQYNFAGIGATGGIPGLSFDSVRAGVAAHVLRMRMYASNNSEVYDNGILGRPLPASHWGKYPNIQDFDGVWAVPGVGYGDSVLKIVDEMVAGAKLLSPGKINVTEQTLEDRVSILENRVQKLETG